MWNLFTYIDYVYVHAPGFYWTLLSMLCNMHNPTQRKVGNDMGMNTWPHEEINLCLQSVVVVSQLM